LQLTRNAVEDALRLVGLTGNRAEADAVALEARCAAWAASRAVWTRRIVCAVALGDIALQHLASIDFKERARRDHGIASLQHLVRSSREGPGGDGEQQ
jgi:hypothetical protein